MRIIKLRVPRAKKMKNNISNMLTDAILKKQIISNITYLDKMTSMNYSLFKMKRYELLDISGDAGLNIWANDLEELLINAALGMSELITDTSMIKETEKRDFIIISDNNEGLLVQWLNELIFQFDTHGFIGKKFKLSLKKNKLEGEISGGIFDPQINESRLLIKAATYNQLSVAKEGDIWKAKVIFDI